MGRMNIMEISNNKHSNIVRYRILMNISNSRKSRYNKYLNMWAKSGYTDVSVEKLLKEEYPKMKLVSDNCSEVFWVLMEMKIKWEDIKD